MIDCSAINLFEYTAMKRFHSFDNKMKEAEIELWVADLNREVFNIVEQLPLGKNSVMNACFSISSKL